MSGDLGNRTYDHRAQFATSRRLLSCLINESRVIANIDHINHDYIHIKQILPTHDTNQSESVTTDNYILVQVKHGFMELCTNPLMYNHHETNDTNNRTKITQAFDSDDFVYPFYIGTSYDNKYMENDPVSLLNVLCPNLVIRLRDELSSSVHNQIRAYEISESLKFRDYNNGTINQPALVWERSIVEGHPTHPMHRTRRGWSFEETGQYAAECFGEPLIYFVEISRSVMLIRSNFEQLLSTNDWLPRAQDPIQNMIMPVHQGQASTIERLFINTGIAKWVIDPATNTRISRTSAAQVAIRTVCPDGLDYHLKMSVNFQTTSNKRTISQHSIYQGPALMSLLSKTVPSELHIVDELASARYIGGDGGRHTGFPQDDIERQLGVIIRADPEKSLPTENIILAAVLSEHVPGTNIPWLIQLNVAGGLETETQRIDFFRDYTQKFLSAFIPPVRDYGIAIECHSQNTLVRFDSTGRLLGFGFRDFGGISFHRSTLKKHGLDGDYFTHNSTSLTECYEELYDKIFHCGIHSNLFQIMKSLDLHYSGVGQSIIYDALLTLLPINHPAIQLWTQPSVYFKSFIAMRLANSPFDHGDSHHIPRITNFLNRRILINQPITSQPNSHTDHNTNNNINHNNTNHGQIQPKKPHNVVEMVKEYLTSGV